jgi:acyl-coenzyme A thioesterase PaaI-like protein
MTAGPLNGFLEAVGQLMAQTPSADRHESYEVAGAVRTLTALMVDRRVPPGTFDGLLAELARTNDTLRTVPKRAYVDPHDAAQAYIDFSPVAGEANPIGPPLRLTVEDSTRVIGEAQFEQQHEGPPGHVHGGVLAAAFDELLGMTQSLSGATGMTGRLTVHYRRPTPLHMPVHFEGQVQNVSGRKISVIGASFIEVEGERVVTAESEGLFISIPPSMFAAMGGF